IAASASAPACVRRCTVSVASSAIASGPSAPSRSRTMSKLRPAYHPPKREIREFSMSKTLKPLSRRSLLKGAAGLAATGLAAPALAQQARELRIVMAGGSWRDFIARVFADPFAAANHVELVWRLGIGQEPMIMAQARRPQWDLSHSNQTRAGQLGSMG